MKNLILKVSDLVPNTIIVSDRNVKGGLKDANIPIYSEALFVDKMIKIH